jgi:hypothetical protein
VSSSLSAAHLIVCKSCRGAGHGTARLQHWRIIRIYVILTKEGAWRRLIALEPDGTFGLHRIAIGVARRLFLIAAPTTITKSP